MKSLPTCNHIIITAQSIFNDLEQSAGKPTGETNGRFLESDCRTYSGYLQESDCACAMTSPALEQSHLIVDQQTAVQWTGYTRPLTANYHLCFDIHGQGGGVAVVNDAAHQLLQQFQSPQPIAAGWQSVPDKAKAQTAVTHLAQIGLLKPAATPHLQTRPANNALTAWLHVTNDCNLRCDYCYVDKTPDKMALDKGYQAVDAVFRSAVKQQFKRVKLKYAGGEATLNFSTVLALHRYAQQLAVNHSLQLDGVVLSNGVAISNRMIEAMKELGLRLMISLDGVGAYHDGQRPFINGHGSFQHIERTLDRLAKHQLVPSISITISQRNLSGLADTVAYALERNLPFTLNFFRDNACTTSSQDLAYEENQIIQAMLAAFQVIEANLPPYSLLGSLIDLAYLDNAHERTCGVGQSYMVINHQGGVAKCHMELGHTVSTVMDDDPLRFIQLDQIGIQNLPVSEKEGCRTCEWQNWCAGGCPALTHRVTGQYNLKSPNCRIYKALFSEVLRLEGLRLLKYTNLLPA